MRVVLKFGGTSLPDGDGIRRCASLVREQAGQHSVISVVSAMSGVTDSLLELADAAADGNGASTDALLGELRDRHEAAARILGADDVIRANLDRLEKHVTDVVATGEVTAGWRDALVAFGEILSCELMAAALDGLALTGRQAGIVTDDQFGEADPIMEVCEQRIKETLEPLLSRGQPVVVTGFVAGTQDNTITTLGRGGSDYTATIIAAALGADEVWLWSDVDGLMSADPRIVPDAKLVETITFAEATEMGQFGAKSMHARALDPAAEHGIPVRIRNTFNPGCPGTLISDVHPRRAVGDTIRAILLLRGSAVVTVAGAAMIGRPGAAAKVFDALADAEVSVRMISQSVSEAGISLVVAGPQLDRARSALEQRLLATKVARHVEVEERAAVVAAIGSGMRGRIGVAARVFGAVADRGIKVLAIALGASKSSICFVVKDDVGPDAVRALHDEFDLGS